MRFIDKIKKLLGSSGLFTDNVKEDEYAQILSSIGYGEKSLLAVSEIEQLFQIIDDGKGYLFVSSDGENYITEFDDIPDKIFSARQNFVVSKGDITSIDIGVDYSDEEGSMIEYAEMRLRWIIRVKGNKGYKKHRKSLSFVLTDDIEEQKLRSFFSGAGKLDIMPSKEFDKISSPRLTDGERETRRCLIAALICLPAASLLSMIGAANTHSDGLQKFLITICALLPFAVFALYFIFQRYLVIRRENNMNSNERTLEIDLSLAGTMSFEIFLAIYGSVRLYNLPFEHLGRWVLTTLILVIILMWMLFALTSEVKRSGARNSIYSICVYFVYAVLISFYSVYLLNYSLDFIPPKVYQAEISDRSVKHAQEYRVQEEYYVYTLRLYDMYEEFKVSYDDYESAKVGDSVTIEEHSGAFGIKYKTIRLKD